MTAEEELANYCIRCKTCEMQKVGCAV